MTPPPNGGPPDGPERRRDAGSRAIIEKQEAFEKRLTSELEELKDALTEMKRELHDRPKEARLYVILGGCAVAVLLFVLALVEKGAATTKEVVAAKLEATETRLLGALRETQLTQQLEQREIYKVVPKRARSAVLERPPPARDGGTEDDT